MMRGKWKWNTPSRRLGRQIIRIIRMSNVRQGKRKAPKAWKKQNVNLTSIFCQRRGRLPISSEEGSESVTGPPQNTRPLLHKAQPSRRPDETQSDHPTPFNNDSLPTSTTLSARTFTGWIRALFSFQKRAKELPSATLQSCLVPGN